MVDKICKKFYISIGNNNIGEVSWLNRTRKVESVVSWVRDKKITGYRISKETNAREMSIIALAQGRAKVKNISFETALGLIDFYDKNHQKFEKLK